MFKPFEEMQLLRKQQNLDFLELSNNFKIATETIKQWHGLSSLDLYEETVNNFKIATETIKQWHGLSSLDLYEETVNNFKIATETIKQWHGLSGLDLYEETASNFKIATETIKQWHGLSGLDLYEETVNNFKIATETIKQWHGLNSVNSYEKIINNLKIMEIGVEQWNKVTSSFKNEKYIRISEELEEISTIFKNKKLKNSNRSNPISSTIFLEKEYELKKSKQIAININLLCLTEMLDSVNKILKLLISLKENKLNFLILCLCLCLGSLKASIVEKISDEIISNSKAGIKRIIKEYKKNNFETFSNLGIIMKNNTILYEVGKSEKITTIEYGQIITYEKTKGRFILVKYTKNGEIYEGVILKKYLKKLD